MYYEDYTAIDLISASSGDCGGNCGPGGSHCDGATSRE